ncbi:TonB system transport protein TonB [Erwinia tasmaniensis]|uniref:TonB system transport protein TonB n=1 Tax=Erwinia tasmaniensis TaxID=338565 RepID=UPI003A4E4D29
MTTLTETSLPRRFSLPVLLSIALHAMAIGGILYASFHQSVKLPEASQPISVSLVAPAVQPVPQAAPQPVPPQETVPEPEPEAVPEPEQPKPVPVAIPKPVPKPKPRPKPKSRPEPVRKEVVKPKKQVKPETETRHAAPFSEHPATAPAPSTAPKTSSTPSTSSVSSGPKAVNIGKPAYPTRALALRIEGQVRVQFDVDSSGQVENIRIISAEPRNMFERDVRQTMKKWRYEPNKPGKDIKMNVMFRINGGSSIE